MKKHYKTKPKNITKLKTYINAITTNNKGNRTGARDKRSNTKHNDIY